jgi:hypothetical protein
LNTSTPALTPKQELLAAACKQAFPAIRNGQDFLNVFSPRTLMESVYPQPALREELLVTVVQMNRKIARKISLPSAIESLEIAISEQIAQPNALVATIEPSNMVQYLDHDRLWSLIVEPAFWETTETDAAQKAKDFFATLLATALQLRLLTEENLIREIGFPTFFAKESKESLIAAVESFANQPREQAFGALVKRHDPKRLAETIPLQTLWTKIVSPLIARQRGREDLVQAKPPPYPPPSSPGPGLHASTIPPALRVSDVHTQKTEASTADPKDDNVPRDETQEEERTVSRFTPTELLHDVDSPGATGDATVVTVPLSSFSTETPQPPSSRISGPPQAPRPPRPRRITHTDVATIEIGEGTMNEGDLLDEPGDDPEEKRGPAYISETQFREAGGGIASDPMPWHSDGSLAISGRSALCGLLRSVGLKLPKVDPLACDTYEMIIQALQEINPNAYTTVRERFEKKDMGALKQALSKEIRIKYETGDFSRLQEILTGMETAPEQRPSASGAKRPPPLPPTPKSAPIHASTPAPSFTPPAPATGTNKKR